MIHKETKQNYLKIISTLSVDKSLTLRLKKFVETYNGTNVKEFQSLMLYLLRVLIHQETLIMKAEGFDKIAKIKRAVDSEIADISELLEETQGKVKVPLSSKSEMPVE